MEDTEKKGEGLERQSRCCDEVGYRGNKRSRPVIYIVPHERRGRESKFKTEERRGRDKGS